VTVTYRTESTTAIIQIARPDRRNAVDRETAEQLVAAFEKFDADEACKVAVFAGSDGVFCAGADLLAISEGEASRVSEDGIAPMGPSRLRLTKPVIAAIEGYAVAGGLELALWCDLRVVATDAVMGVFCRRFGVPLVDMGSIRLPRLIGHSRAMDLILTGRPVEAEEALAIGLANRVAPAGKTLAKALELAEQIAAFPQGAMRGDRQSAIDQWSLSEANAIINEVRIGVDVIESGETRAGASNFRDGKGRHGGFGKTP